MTMKTFISYGLACCLLSSVACAKNLYRFKDENGALVIKDTMPPHLVPLGYTILNERGKVVEVVPPAKTPEQIEADRAERKRQKEIERERLIAEKNEQLFLNSFTSPKDIIRTKETQMSAVEVRKRIAKGNIERLEDQIRRLRERAADFERRNMKIPEYIEQEITKSIQQIEDNKNSITEKTNTQQLITDSFNGKLEQFQTIWSRNVVKVLQKQRKLPPLTRVVSSCDSTKEDCQHYWKQVVAFVQQHNTSGIEVEFDNSIVSKPANEPEHIALHAAMVNLIGETTYHYVLRIECQDSRKGDTLCASEQVSNLLSQFNDNTLSFSTQ